ncbi:hypothetical protein ATK36_5611 [Amycolatopsis sulphurea]|uniref:Uncharacterized protein n=1 Tax=Amycolatopsis sulphurea TaxID=76022 RepID=A0A2A9FIP9_9PSEU|nr:hypothetical protein ATK36_5611 [Amycolatopsis sulphurea]
MKGPFTDSESVKGPFTASHRTFAVAGAGALGPVRRGQNANTPSDWLSAAHLFG